MESVVDSFILYFLQTSFIGVHLITRKKRVTIHHSLSRKQLLPAIFLIQLSQEI